MSTHEIGLSLVEEYRNIVEKENVDLREAQREMREAFARNLSILVVDGGAGYSGGSIKKGLAQSEQYDKGGEGIREGFIESVLYGYGDELPQGILPAVRALFGPHITLDYHDVMNDERKDLRKYNLVFFSGSVADISMRMRKIERRSVESGQYTIPHKKIFNNMRKVMDACAEMGVPGMGVCFSHQLASHRRGGEVVRMHSGMRTGLHSVQPTAYGSDVTMAVFGRVLKGGEIWESHHEEVATINHKKSLLLFTSDSSHVHEGMLHLPHNRQDTFTDDTALDIQRVIDVMKKGLGLLFTTQGHVEGSMGGMQNIVTFGRTGDVRTLTEQKDNALPADIVRLITNFMALHTYFGKKH